MHARRALAFCAAVLVVSAVSAARAGASPPSTYKIYAHAIEAPGSSESVGECSATGFPGSAAATGAPDGNSWTIDVSQRVCDSDDHDAMVRFTLPDCGSFSGITGIHGIITNTAQSTQNGHISWGIINPANNLVSPGAQLAPDTAGEIVTDFSGAPLPIAQLLSLLATKSMVLFETKADNSRVYNIDSFALAITGDLSHCHIDQDGDGLDNVQEAHYGTNPLVADTDGGGVNDGVEVARGSNPLDPSDDRNWPPPTTTSTTTTTVAHLPNTGSSSAPLGAAATLFVVAGASAVAIASRRDRAARSRR